MTDNTFAVVRSDLAETRTYNDQSAEVPLREGQARLRVGPFALTANNVTYAKLGDAMGYFGFYPARDESEGRVPVWGFADVVESRVKGVDAGTRIYGFLPISSHTIVEPVDVSPSGFVDGAAHRSALPPLYNRYTACASDPLYEPAHEAYLSLLRPLFTTAFLIEDVITSKERFGAEHVVLSSASSKTAYATAFNLAQRRGTEKAASVIGLTSPAHRTFVEQLGCYDSVLTYDDIGALPPSSAVLFDMAGNGAVRAAVHAHYADQLKASFIVGATHWDAPPHREPMPGPAPEIFFAPTVAATRLAEWGPADFQARLGRAWHAFMDAVTNEAAPWLNVVSREGIEAGVEAYQRLLRGESAAADGIVVTV